MQQMNKQTEEQYFLCTFMYNPYLTRISDVFHSKTIQVFYRKQTLTSMPTLSIKRNKHLFELHTPKLSMMKCRTMNALLTQSVILYVHSGEINCCLTLSTNL